jgi:hypothetical protein
LDRWGRLINQKLQLYTQTQLTHVLSNSIVEQNFTTDHCQIVHAEVSRNMLGTVRKSLRLIGIRQASSFSATVKMSPQIIDHCPCRNMKEYEERA